MAKRPMPGRSPHPDPKPGAFDLVAAAREIVAALPDAVVVTGTDRHLLTGNRAAADLFGRALEDLPGTAVDDLVAVPERARVAEYERRAFGGDEQRYETQIVRGDGAARDVAVSTTPLTLKGHLVGTVATLRDITEARRAQEALARSETRFHTLFEAASDAIITLDAKGRFTTVNQAAEHVSGYRRAELLGQGLTPMLPDDALPMARLHFRKALAGATGLLETTFIRKDGDTRTIQVTYSTPFKNDEVLCVIRDVTDQKLLQEQLIQSAKMSAIGQLVSGVAHELNNPLAGIAAFAQLLLGAPRIAREDRTAAEMIYGESRRAARIVQSLLIFARQHKPERVPTSINQVFDDTLELRAYDLRVRGIAVVRDYDPGLPDILSDAHQLQQVFLNLVTNAEQAMDEQHAAEPQLTVRTRRAGDLIRIEIEDRGPGIAQNLVDRIFTPFFTTKPTGSGTGLGLSISLGIVREHGGRIWAENAATGGARFTVELPVVIAAPGARVPAPPVAPAAADRLRILVVDDEPSVRMALERYFTGRGHETETTASGREALARLQESTFDIVIVDLRMPDLSGEDLYAALRARDAIHAARVIFTTGQLLDDHVRAFLASTARPLVPKPFEFSSLEQVVASVRRAR